MRAVVSDNPMWEAFAWRPLTAAIYGGADLGEILSTVARVGDGGSADDWHREWTATADRIAGIGDAAAAAGHRVSAHEAYFRAASYYQAAWFPLFGAPVDPRATADFGRQSAMLEVAAPLCDPPVELLEIPFEQTTLPGYFVAVDGSGVRRPTIVHTNGYDSSIQEMFFAHAPAATRRGYNVVLFDGPGQGRNLVRDGMPIRPDWESVVTPVLDFVLERPDVDPARVVLAGWSFGGFLAPRAAAFEHRIAALIADPGQWDQRDTIVHAMPLADEDRATFPDIDPAKLAPMEQWLKGPDGDPMLRWKFLQRGLWVHDKRSLFDYLADLCRFEVSSVAQDIRCPTLLTQAEGDPSAAGAQKLLDTIDAERKALVHFSDAEGAGGHCEGSARRLYHQRVFDWLDETLASV